MKLIVVAAAALALVAGSVDVEAHCGECKLDKSGGDKESLGGGKTAAEKQRPLHLARFAVAHFDGLTGEDRTRLIEAAQNGDETAQEELEAAVTAGLERVRKLTANEDALRMMCMGITIGQTQTVTDDSGNQSDFMFQEAANLTVDGSVNEKCGSVIADLEEQINTDDLLISSRSW